MTIAGAMNAQIDYDAFEKGGSGMCTVFEEIANEAELKGIEQGELENSKKMFKKCLKRGDSKQEAMDFAEIDQSLADELYEEFKKEQAISTQNP